MLIHSVGFQKYGITTSWVEKNLVGFLLIGHGHDDNNGKITRNLRQDTNMYNTGIGEAEV